MDDRPVWTRPGCARRLWVEDECLRNDPDAEHLHTAWQRLFGEEYDPDRVLERYDGGDCFGLLFSEGRVVWHSYDGDSICQAHVIGVVP